MIPKSLLEVPYGSTFYLFMSAYVSFYEYIGHAVIALNRYTVFVHPISSQK
ncbi:hypothetical protein AAVH_16782, partial [Aphelenchoides avenae]